MFADLCRALFRSAEVSPEADGQMKRTEDMDKDHLAAAPKQQLPEPAGLVFFEGGTYEQGWLSSQDAYTADQLRAAIAAERAENKRLRDACAAGWGEPALINTLRAELSTLRQQLAEAGRDAKRMQFMEKDVYMLDAVSDPDSLVQVWVGPKQRLSTGRTVRAAIDAAIAAQGEAK